MNKSTSLLDRISSILLLVAAAFAVIGIITSTNSSNNSDKPSNDNMPVTETAESESPKIETKTETVTEPISHDVKTVEDNSLEYGKTKITTEGADGIITYTYEVTYEDGKETSRKQISKETTKKPITKVIAKGTKIIWHCTDATSFDRNPYNDNKCTNSKGQVKYVCDSEARKLDPSYDPPQIGPPYYNI
ncbi:G5 domain-containing protein [Candidatus Saccharibacteria bacterium]|nr:G5 domain-containing protein [Candidatus Saccharibacteria bacterium]